MTPKQAALAARLQQVSERQLLVSVTKRPGLGIRALARHSGLSPTTVSLALQRLQANGKARIVRHGGSLLAFPADHADLRVPPDDNLRALLRIASGRTQKEILDVMEPRGWRRSTTQHRLGRLVEQGHLEIQRDGRWVMYTRTR